MPASILIVEDTESLALLYQSYLIPTGLKTFVAGTGQAALDYLDTNQPDLIILDIMLPDMLIYLHTIACGLLGVDKSELVAVVVKQRITARSW